MQCIELGNSSMNKHWPSCCMYLLLLTYQLRHQLHSTALRLLALAVELLHSASSCETQSWSCTIGSSWSRQLIPLDFEVWILRFYSTNCPMIYSSKDDRCYRFVFCGQDVWESRHPSTCWPQAPGMWLFDTYTINWRGYIVRSGWVTHLGPSVLHALADFKY